ncbi:hypothetical protein [Cecembia sp.]|uniref:hypothetical protein n=1 Tax=Cecembia sp. TaxID=1898110 RepID=UPI0025C0155B|nr:hypothetical protein [Cecembia sp.]
MRKCIPIFLTLTVFIILGCDTTDSINPIDSEIARFKTETTLQFNGKVLNENIAWRFDWNGGVTIFRQSFWCVADNKAIQQRNFGFSKNDPAANLRSLKIISPALDTADTYSTKLAIFDVGKKEFQTTSNTVFDGFIIQGTTKDGCFSTYFGDQNKSSIEIVRLQELQPDSEGNKDYKRVRLWTVVTCDLYSCSGDKIGTIEKGRFITEVDIERNL